MSNITSEGAAVQIDPIADSIKYCLVVVFNKSTSKNYPVTVNVAKQACVYSEQVIDKTIVHRCAFSAEQLPLSRALYLLTHIKGFKTTQLFSRGKQLHSAFEIESVIRCYLDSMECKDWKAHCLKIETSDDGLFRYILPCKRLSHFGVTTNLQLQQDVASVPYLIEALAVKKGCNWCPNFHYQNYKALTPMLKKEKKDEDDLD